MTTKRKCTSLTRSGTPCKAWAVHETNPPRCAAHGGGKEPVGAPKDNRNATKHGLYSSQTPETGALTGDLAHRIKDFASWLDRQAGEMSLEDAARYLNVLSQIIARYVRTQRILQAIGAGTAGADSMEEAVNWALDRLSDEWNIEL